MRPAAPGTHDWDFETAEREFRRAEALDPNNPTPTLWYGHFCIVRNRFPQALEENSHLLKIEPVSALFNTVRGEIYTRRIFAGLRICRRKKRTARHLNSLIDLQLGRAQAMRGDYARPKNRTESFDLVARRDPDLPVYKEAKAEYAALIKPRLVGKNNRTPH